MDHTYSLTVKGIMKMVAENSFLFSALEDFFNNEPSEELAVVFGLKRNWEYWPNLDSPEVKKLQGEAVFPLSDGTKWRATVKNATWYGGNDELTFSKIS